MDVEQGFKHLEDIVRANFEATRSQIDDLGKRFEKIETAHISHAEKLIRLEMRIEESVRDLEQYKNSEAQFGRQFDNRIKELETKTDDMKGKLIKYGTIITILAGMAGLGGGLI